jgi:short-subunit dehydrogenase
MLVSNCKASSLKGAVINLSSNASILNSPLLVAYTAAKAYNKSFSNALAGELRMLYPNLIDVMCLRPSFVESRMSGLKADSDMGRRLNVIKADVFAKDALNKLGSVDDISPVKLFLLNIYKFSNCLF